MDEALKSAITKLADAAKAAATAHEAMQYAQAALSLAHTISILHHSSSKGETT